MCAAALLLAAGAAQGAVVLLALSHDVVCGVGTLITARLRCDHLHGHALRGLPVWRANREGAPTGRELLALSILCRAESIVCSTSLHILVFLCGCTFTGCH